MAAGQPGHRAMPSAIRPRPKSGQCVQPAIRFTATEMRVPGPRNGRTACDSQAGKTTISPVRGRMNGSTGHRVPQKTEIFFGESRGNLPLFAKTVIDAGADLVLGHGPHVLRGMEIYKDRLIAYSLGNFATYGWFRLAGATAETMVLEVKIDAGGKFVGGKINPFVLLDRGILTPDSSKSAIFTIRRLSQMDFPTSAPKVADDGTISK